MDDYWNGYEDGQQFERSEIAEMLRAKADVELAAGSDAGYYALRAAAWSVDARSTSPFRVRVMRATMMQLEDIPVGTATDLLAGHVVAHDRESGTWVFFGGYPTHVDDDGNAQWDVSSARKVTL